MTVTWPTAGCAAHGPGADRGASMAAMSFPPAVWTVAPGADEDEVSQMLERLAEQLGIATPQITTGNLMLPADYPRVARALGKVEPDWEDLLVPPVA